MSERDPTDPVTERWRPIAGFDGRYEVSDQGRVRSLFTTPPRIIGSPVPGPRRIPYRQVTLHRKDSTRANALIHQLVLAAFVGPAPIGLECRHLDGDPGNNRLANLAWGTARQNAQDRDRHDATRRGERHGNAKLTEAAVREIRTLATTTSQRALATRFGVAQVTIHRILSGQCWSTRA